MCGRQATTDESRGDPRRWDTHACDRDGVQEDGQLGAATWDKRETRSDRTPACGNYAEVCMWHIRGCGIQGVRFVHEKWEKKVDDIPRLGFGAAPPCDVAPVAGLNSPWTRSRRVLDRPQGQQQLRARGGLRDADLSCVTRSAECERRTPSPAWFGGQCVVRSRAPRFKVRPGGS